MGRYLASRVLQGLFVLWGATLVTFAIVRLVPGDPARVALGDKASPEAIAQLRSELGLDHGLVYQYFSYLGGLLHGDLGTSLTFHAPVTDLIGPRLGVSFALVIFSIALALTFGVPAALAGGMRPGSLGDHFIRLVSIVFWVIPSFWLGLILALVLGLKFGLFPTSGYDNSSLGGMLRTLALPALTLAVFTFPPIVRVLRSSIVGTFRSDYVDAANARGLGNVAVLRRYVLRNSLTSVTTLLGVTVGALLGSAVVIEQVFALPGLGSLLVSSVAARDYQLVQGIAFVYAAIVIAANLAADVIQMLIDPRVRA